MRAIPKPYSEVAIVTKDTEVISWVIMLPEPLINTSMILFAMRCPITVNMVNR